MTEKRHSENGVPLFYNVIIPLIHQNKRCYIKNGILLAVIFPPPQAGERYGALNYPFVYRIFSWCAKGIVIFYNVASEATTFPEKYVII